VRLTQFVTGLRPDDLREATRRRLELLLADLAAVCVRGRPAIDCARDLSPPPPGRGLRDLGASELLHVLCGPVLAIADA
jgi:hypothetical protein